MTGIAEGSGSGDTEAGGAAAEEAEGTAAQVMAKVEGKGSAVGSGSGDSSSPTTIGDGRLVLHAADGQSAVLDMASGDSNFQIGNKAGAFVITSGETGGHDRLVINPKGDVAFNVPDVHSNSLTSESHLAVKGVPQWRITTYDNFDSPSEKATRGWSANALPLATDSVKPPTLLIGVSKECGVSMLGGPGIFNQAGSVSKVFTLGKDVSRARVTAHFHFIDDWSGQSGYLKTSTLEHGEDGAKMGKSHTVWTRQYAVVPRELLAASLPKRWQHSTYAATLK